MEVQDLQRANEIVLEIEKIRDGLDLLVESTSLCRQHGLKFYAPDKYAYDEGDELCPVFVVESDSEEFQQIRDFTIKLYKDKITKFEAELKEL